MSREKLTVKKILKSTVLTCDGKKRDRMKVLYITTVPAPYKVQLFEELGKYCDLTVLFEMENVSYRDNSWMQNEFKNFKFMYLKGLNVRDKKISFGIIKHLKHNTYDLIIMGVYSTIPQMLAQVYMNKKNIPYIISSDGGLVKEEGLILSKLKKYFISSAKAWLSTGKITTEYLAYYGANVNKTYVYPFTSIYKADILAEPLTIDEKISIRKKLNISEEKMILTVGQFIYRKGYDVLLKACEKLDKNIGVYIVGGKPTQEYIQMQKDMNLTNVHFLDFMNKEEISKYYKAADLFVLPTREDIWGLVINEAMAYGLPVITTDKCVAGIEMIKKDKNGLLIKPNDTKELENAITEFSWLINEKSSITSLEIAKQYTIEEMARKHLDFFESIIKN